VTLQQVYLAEKKLVRGFTWSADGRDLRTSAPLSIGEVVVEGLEVHIRTTKPLADRDVHFMLLVSHGPNSKQLLERVCWRPKTPHNNKGRGPSKYRHKILDKSHVHDMFLNWDPVSDQMISQDLNIALPIDIDSCSVHEAFEISMRRFNVSWSGITFTPPPWERDLLDGE
jgi:hypothetical protein